MLAKLGGIYQLLKSIERKAVLEALNKELPRLQGLFFDIVLLEKAHPFEYEKFMENKKNLMKEQGGENPNEEIPTVEGGT